MGLEARSLGIARSFMYVILIRVLNNYWPWRDHTVLELYSREETVICTYLETGVSQYVFALRSGHSKDMSRSI